jgi:hypothetical protein
MQFWKFATILALASIPLLLLNTAHADRKVGVRPIVGDDDNIFERELTTN